jgi:N-acetylmuramoyl-L-alanine amidase
VGTKPLQYNSFALYEPERVVIDLSEFKAYPGLDTTAISNQLIKKLRFSQFQPDTLRLVADLTQQCGYQLVNDPQNVNRVLLVLNYLVQNVNFVKQDGAEQVQIKTSYPAVYKVFQLSRPLRTVIDFTGATLAAPQSVVDTNGNYFRRVRISQFDPRTVRVVLEVADTNWRYQVIPSRKDLNVIEARTLQRVRTIECLEPTSEITRLVLTGSGELHETVRKLKAPARLRIDLDFFQFAPSLHKPLVDRLSQIKGVELQTLSPTRVRIEAELKYLAGYEVKLSEDYQQLVVTFTKSPLIGKTFVLDPGHGGVDSGAVGKQGLREKDINFEVALRLQELLAAAGANVVLTRNGDYYIGLYERNFIANQLSGDLFISIHANYHPNPNIHGVEVYSYPDMVDSVLLAKLVEAELVKQTQLPGLGVKYNDFVVIRESVVPSILVEMGYLSYEPEEALMKTAEFKDQAALGIYKGIIAYYYTRQSDKNEK